MLGKIKKLLTAHFRIIALVLLSIAILSVFFSTKEENEMLPFRTYMFDVDGSGSMSGVAIGFDFGNGSDVLSADITPGNYSLQSNIPFTASCAGSPGCTSEAGGNSCRLNVANACKLSIRFNGSTLMPNGRFRFSFLNETTLLFKLNLGQKYLYQNLISILPRQLHGHYVPEKNQVVLETVDYGSDDSGDSSSAFVDFDLYSVDALKHAVNQQTDWRENIILVPLVITFLTLLLSEFIDYAHRYLREKLSSEKHPKGK